MPKCRPIPKALTIAETEMSADTDTEISTETDNFRSLVIVISINMSPSDRYKQLPLKYLVLSLLSLDLESNVHIKLTKLN